MTIRTKWEPAHQAQLWIEGSEVLGAVELAWRTPALSIVRAQLALDTAGDAHWVAEDSYTRLERARWGSA